MKTGNVAIVKTLVVILIIIATTCNSSTMKLVNAMVGVAIYSTSTFADI